MIDTSICPVCKCPKKEAETGSLTQWIVVCNCNAPVIEETSELKVSLCRGCGKRIGEGRAGSFTQFIFRSDICSCEVPQPYQVDPSSLPNPIPLPIETGQEIEYETEEGLELEADKFPLDRYKPLKQLGAGGGGLVYLAWDRLLNKLVAVKLIHSIDSKQIIAFQEEARATSKLNHPGIVRLLDFGVTEATVPYMVLEYIPGFSLEDLLSQSGAMDWAKCQKIFSSVCDALTYAHEHGILHRDIKPGNIVLIETDDEREYEVRIIDFGVSKLAKSAASDGEQTIVGAPLYMSPEQGRGLKYDHRSEVYSLGCVIFEAVTGVPPFLGESPLQTLAMHVDEEAPLLSTLVDDVPPDFEQVVAKALAKMPYDRFDTIAEFKQALLSVKAPGMEVDAPEETFDSGGPGSKSKKKQIWITVVSLVLFVLANLAFSQYALQRSIQKSTETVDIEESPASKKSPAYHSDKGFLMNIDESEINKELKWTGGKWKYKTINRKGVVEAAGHVVGDEDFKELQKGQDFQNLKLTMESKSNGSGLRYLKGRKLRQYWTMTNYFNDEGAKYLLDFPDITYVKIHYSSCPTVKTYEYLAKMPGLSALELRSILNLPRGAMAALSKSKTLKSLSLGYTSPFTSEDLRAIARIPKLETLKLNGVKDVDDSMVPALMKLKLTHLDISLTNISDRGLEKLADMKSLRLIDLSLMSNAIPKASEPKSSLIANEGITNTGLLRFKAKNPRCKVKIFKTLAGVELF